MVKKTSDRVPKRALYIRPLPYNLRAIFLTTTLFTPLSGGILSALNWGRLDRPVFAIPALLFGALVFVVNAAIVNLLIQQPQPAIAFAFLLIANAWAGLILLLSQRRAFQRWKREHGGKVPAINQSGCITYLVILVITVIAGYVALFHLSGPVGELLLRLRPEQTVQVEGFQMIAAGNWIQIDTNLLSPSYCIQPGAKCLYAGARPGSEMVFGIRRLSGPDYEKATPEQFDTRGWELMQEQVEGVELISQQARTIGGQPATERVITQPDSEFGRLARMIVLIKEASGSLVQFDLTANVDSFRQHQNEIERMLASLRFTGE